MSEEKSKSTVPTWVLIILVVGLFVGYRMITGEGLSTTAVDSFSADDAPVEWSADQTTLLEYLGSYGAAALCADAFDEDMAVRERVTTFFDRNNAKVEELVERIEASGGMSSQEKDALDRQAGQKAREYHGRRAPSLEGCQSLLQRMDAGELDLT